MTPNRNRRLLDGIIVVAVVAAVALAAVYAITPNIYRPAEHEGRPLLEWNGPQFIDKQVGITFTPPTGWALQSISTESPTTHKAERTVVKFKRLAPGPKAAWLKVTVSEVTGNPTVAELIRTRKPREAHFTPTKEPEDNLTIAGQPASRSTFGGDLEPDAKGSRHCTTEIVAIRHGAIALYFMGTYASADPEAQKMIRDSIETLVLQKK